MSRDVKRAVTTARNEPPRPEDKAWITVDPGQPTPWKDLPRLKRPHRKRRIVGLILGLIVVAIIAYAALIGYNLSKLSTRPFAWGGLTSDQSGRVNILVLGEGDPGHAGEDLTDTMMVLSVNKTTHQVAQISVPRDLQVSIPGYGEAKINSANADGGVKLAEQTVSNTLGIPINYYVLTNFSGLEGIVNAVGGLDINVKTALIDTEYPCADNQYKVCGLDIEPGLQHMNGATVLEYTRCRKGTCGNDFGRAARQQEVLGLLRQKVVRYQTLLNPKQVESLTTAMRSALTTDMSATQLVQLAYDWQRAQNNHPIQLVLSTSTGGYLVSSGDSSDLLPADGTFEAIRDRVANIFTEPTKSTDVPSN